MAQKNDVHRGSQSAGRMMVMMSSGEGAVVRHTSRCVVISKPYSGCHGCDSTGERQRMPTFDIDFELVFTTR